jgi:hypothetical protein
MLSKKNDLGRMMLSVFGVASLLLATSSAKAACGSFSSLGQRSAVRLPMLGQAANEEWRDARDPIVGLWHVVYTAGGKVFNETLDQWHSDGTEFENAFLPPAAGDICFGVWKPTGWHTVKLHHIGWTFDGTGKTTADGTFTLDEANKVAEDGNTYTGTFTFKTFPNTGTGVEVTGTILATRITVD